jgi:predicted aspartyl protease
VKRLTVLVVLLTLVSSAAAQADEACKKLSGVAQVEMRTPGGASPEILATIAGHDRPLVVDTGAYITSFTQSAVSDLGLKPHHTDAGIEDILGNVSEEVTFVPTLRIGRLTAEDFKVFIFPDEFGKDYNDYRHAHGGFDGDLAGLFGEDFLRSYDVDLDFGAGKLRLWSSDHCPNKVVYWHPQAIAVVPIKLSREGHTIITMTLDGQEVDALVDTGSDRSMLSAKVAKKLFDITPDASAAKPVDIDGQKVTGVFAHRFSTLVVDGLTISNPEIIIQPDFVADGKGLEDRWNANRVELTGDAPLVLGIHELRKLHLYIDYHDKELFISPAGDEVLPPTLMDSPAGSAGAATN